MNTQNYSNSLVAAIKLAKAMAHQDKHLSFGVAPFSHSHVDRANRSA